MSEFGSKHVEPVHPDDRQHALDVRNYFGEYSKWQAGLAMLAIGGGGIGLANEVQGWAATVFMITIGCMAASLVCAAIGLIFLFRLYVEAIEQDEKVTGSKVAMLAFFGQIGFFILGILGFVATVFGIILQA